MGMAASGSPDCGAGGERGIFSSCGNSSDSAPDFTGFARCESFSGLVELVNMRFKKIMCIFFSQTSNTSLVTDKQGAAEKRFLTESRTGGRM